MKKTFQIGMPIEDDTEYFATEAEYHVFSEDTTEVCDRRYAAMRGNASSQAFNVFMLIKNKKNITVDFGGATLVMHSKIQPFLIDGCENVTLKNCNVTYDRPMYTEALITEVTPSYARLKLNARCTCRVEGDQLIPYGTGWENRRLNWRGVFFQLFDPVTRRGCGITLGAIGTPFIKDESFPYSIDQFTVEEDGDTILLKGRIPDVYRVGKVLVIEHEGRTYSNVFAIDSKHLTLENYRILSGEGMGLFAYRVEDILLDRFLLTHDEKSPCLISNSADAVHSFGTSGNFVIRNSVFEGMIDDAINIHSNFRTVDHVCDDVIYTNRASCEKQAQDLYRVGDEIAVYRGQTMEEVARYTVRKIERIDDDLARITVDRPVEAHARGDLIESLSANCDVTIENCIFGKANTHLRLQSRGKFVIRNCESELPFLLTGDTTYWFESGPITDLTVENCRFIGECARISIESEVQVSEAAPYYHKNIKILNNVFETAVPLIAREADGIVFKCNQNGNGEPMKLTLINCGTAETDGCMVERILQKDRSIGLN